MVNKKNRQGSRGGKWELKLVVHSSIKYYLSIFLSDTVLDTVAT